MAGHPGLQIEMTRTNGFKLILEEKKLSQRLARKADVIIPNGWILIQCLMVSMEVRSSLTKLMMFLRLEIITVVFERC